MRHRVSGRKLGRRSEHREALMNNLVSQLLRHERVYRKGRSPQRTSSRPVGTDPPAGPSTRSPRCRDRTRARLTPLPDDQQFLPFTGRTLPQHLQPGSGVVFKRKRESVALEFDSRDCPGRVTCLIGEVAGDQQPTHIASFLLGESADIRCQLADGTVARGAGLQLDHPPHAAGIARQDVDSSGGDCALGTVVGDREPRRRAGHTAALAVPVRGVRRRGPAVPMLHDSPLARRGRGATGRGGRSRATHGVEGP